MDPNLSRNRDVESITLQPSRSFNEVPKMPPENEEEDSKSKKRKENDCCCSPYAADDSEFRLFRCLAWCCVEIGRFFETCGEGCADCITSCCEPQENGHNQDGCCYGGCCEDCDGGDWNAGDNGDDWGGSGDEGGGDDCGDGDDWGGAGDCSGGDDWGGGGDCGGGDSGDGGCDL